MLSYWRLMSTRRTSKCNKISSLLNYFENISHKVSIYTSSFYRQRWFLPSWRLVYLKPLKHESLQTKYFSSNLLSHDSVITNQKSYGISLPSFKFLERLHWTALFLLGQNRFPLKWPFGWYPSSCLCYPKRSHSASGSSSCYCARLIRRWAYPSGWIVVVV